MSAGPRPAPSRPSEALEQAAELESGGRLFEAIDMLTVANRSAGDPMIERHLAQLRHAAFAHLDKRSAFDSWPAPVSDLEARDGPPSVPELAPGDLCAEAVRGEIRRHGCVSVPGLFDASQVSQFVSGIDKAFGVLAAGPDAVERATSSWYAALPLPREEAQSLGRHWVHGSGGMLTADSPRLLFLLLETFEKVGLRGVITDYLGERPALSANKCTLRCVQLNAGTDWHQDGAFLGEGIRSLNVWVALTECGRDAPGMDLLPRRLEAIVETGTGGAIFDWAVGPQVVAQLAVDAPVVRPIFHPGDALLFDDLFMHRTAIDESMTHPRYALESWFFAPSAYPDGHVPIVW